METLPKDGKLHLDDVIKGPEFGPIYHTESPRFNEGFARSIETGEEAGYKDALTTEDGEVIKVKSANVLDKDGVVKRMIITAQDGWVYDIEYDTSKGEGRVKDVHKSEEDFYAAERRAI